MRFYDTNNPLFHRPWSVALADDMHERIVVTKARQMGVTEIMMGIKALHFASMIQSVTLYTLPMWPKAEELAKERLMPLVDPGSPSRVSPTLRAMMVDGWVNLTHKHIVPKIGGGKSAIIITSSWSESLGESTAADAAFLDEFDRMKPGVISAFRKSLDSSMFGFLRVFSTPTFPGHGVALLYSQSDQKRWMYKCAKCGHWQYLTRGSIVQRSGPLSLIQRLEAHDPTARFPKGTFDIACSRCQNHLSRLQPHAEWVAEHPDVKEYSGYSFSQLDCAWHSPDAIMEDLRDMRPGLGPWMNYDLGEAYMGDAGGVTEGWIYTMVNPDIGRVQNRDIFDAHHTNTRVVAGVDWGDTNWMVVRAVCDEYSVPIILRVYRWEETKNPEDAWQFVLDRNKEWRFDAIVADVGYGSDRNPYIYKAFGAAFFACQYPTIRSTTQKPVTSEPWFGPNPPNPADPHPTCKVDRAASLEYVIAMLRRRDYLVAPLAEDDLETLDRHCRNVVIVIQQDERTGQMVKTAVATGDDHLLHCINYSEVADKWARQRWASVGEAPTDEQYRRQELEYMHQHQMPTTGDIAAWKGDLDAVLSDYTDSYGNDDAGGGVPGVGGGFGGLGRF